MVVLTKLIQSCNNIVTALCCQFCDNLVTTGLYQSCYDNLVTSLIACHKLSTNYSKLVHDFRQAIRTQLVDGLLKGLLYKLLDFYVCN